MKYTKKSDKNCYQKNGNGKIHHVDCHKKGSQNDFNPDIDKGVSCYIVNSTNACLICFPNLALDRW